MPVSEEANSLDGAVRPPNWLPFDWPGKLAAKLPAAVSRLLFGKLDAKLDKAKLDAARLLFAVERLFADADQTGRALFSQSIGNSDRPEAAFASSSRLALGLPLVGALLLLGGELRGSLLQYRLERF